MFYEQRGTSCLVVEITEFNRDAYILNDEVKGVNGQTSQPDALSKPESASTAPVINKFGGSLSLAIYAKCSHCFEFGKLAFNCHCHKANYCTEECQNQDLKFHEEKCQGLEVIEKWDQSCKPNADARLGLTGLRNLNNSCYLSSSLQCLSHAIGLS